MTNIHNLRSAHLSTRHSKGDGYTQEKSAARKARAVASAADDLVDGDGDQNVTNPLTGEDDMPVAMVPLLAQFADQMPNLDALLNERFALLDPTKSFNDILFEVADEIGMPRDFVGALARNYVTSLQSTPSRKPSTALAQAGAPSIAESGQRTVQEAASSPASNSSKPASPETPTPRPAAPASPPPRRIL